MAVSSVLRVSSWPAAISYCYGVMVEDGLPLGRKLVEQAWRACRSLSGGDRSRAPRWIRPWCQTVISCRRSLHISSNRYLRANYGQPEERIETGGVAARGIDNYAG
jgi:hypothetical protein